MGKQNTFVKQASFLMIAGLIVRIIGLLYRTPMKAAIGELGYGYYGYAYNVYSILLLISGYSIPAAVSKLMAERLAKKEYKNAQRIFHGSMVYVCISGGLAMLAAFVFADQLLPQGGKDAALALRVLAPSILLAGILGVLRGYFQANNNMLPTSVSQILEQILNAFISVFAAWFFIRSFSLSEDERAIYGAAGGTLGTGAGIVIAILFMGFVFYVNRGAIKRKLRNDKTGHVESYGEIAKVILLMLTPIIFSTFIYNVSGFLDQSVFAPLMIAKGMDGKEITKIYGVFTGQYMVLINVPVALASASSTAMIPLVTGCFAVGDNEGANEKISEAVRVTMFIAIPAMVGLAVLAFPIMHLLFPGSPDTAGYLLISGAITVIFYSQSTITNGVLQGIGKQGIPLKNASMALGIHLVVLVILTCFTDLGIYAVLIATIVYSFTMCLLNNLAIRKYLQYKNEFKDAYIKPLGAALGMGVAAWLTYYGLYISFDIRYINLFAAVIVAIVVYAVLFVMITNAPEEQIRRFPGGNFIIKLTRILHLHK